MRIVALMSVYNEELYLRRCLQHLTDQGVEVFVIDNGSTDGTAEIARGFLGRGVVAVDYLPRRGMFELEVLLQREEQAARELGADWFIHHDADEIRQAPNPFKSLREGIEHVDRAGYNAINFDEFVFLPTGLEESYEHDRFVEEMRYYYYFAAGPGRRINAWKNQPGGVDLRSAGGHQVQFPGRKVFPENFIMRHYIALSHAHVIRKYCGRVNSEVERREKGWNNARASLQPAQIRFPQRDRLCRVSADNTWDRSRPWKTHALFDNVELLPRTPRGTARPAPGKTPPVPFIVGVEHSGARRLRRALEGHADLALLPANDRAVSSSEVPGTRRRLDVALDDLQRAGLVIDEATLCSRLGGVEPDESCRLLGELGRWHAEHRGKRRWGDESAWHLMEMERIGETIPEARFVHVIRDGRDVAAAQRETAAASWSPEEAATQWVFAVAQARRQAQNLDHYLELQLEGLLRDPRQALRQICDFLQLVWDPALIDGLRALEQQPATLTDTERVAFERLAAGTLRELGYAVP